MKQLVFGTSDLPNNFRLENYDACAIWGVAEWWRALAYRRQIHLFITTSLEDSAQQAVGESDGAIEFVKGCAISYFDKPLPDFDEENRVHRARGMRSPIRDFTASDFYRGLYKLNDESYKPSVDLAKKVVKQIAVLDGDDDFDAATDIPIQWEGIRAMVDLDMTPAWTLHRAANAPKDSFCIEVELGDSDEYLVKEFKGWLKRIRKEAGIPKIPKQFSPSDFADWHAKRLLPYLDLTLWARANGGSINLPVLGYALFPDEPARDHVRGVESMIRRTVGPQARSILTSTVISTLCTQMEKAETQKQ